MLKKLYGIHQTVYQRPANIVLLEITRHKDLKTLGGILLKYPPFLKIENQSVKALYCYCENSEIKPFDL